MIPYIPEIKYSINRTLHVASFYGGEYLIGVATNLSKSMS